MQCPELIKAIKHRPGLFLGNISIYTLKAFLDGYKYAKGEDELSNILDSFQQFIANKYNMNRAIGWDSVIRLHCSNERQAFDRFFELFDEFLEKPI